MKILANPTACPTCGGKLWDNRATKKNPKAPDYKCRDKACDGCFWPPKPGVEAWEDEGAVAVAAPAPRAAAPAAPARVAVSNPPYVAAIDGTLTVNGDAVLNGYLRSLEDAATSCADVLRAHGITPTAEAICAAAATLHISRSRG